MRPLAWPVAALAALALTACGGGAAGGSTSEESDTDSTGYVAITDQQGSVEGFVGASDDAVIDRCEVDGDGWIASGTVTNPESEPQDYRVYVAFTENRDTHGLVQVDVTGVPADGTESWSVEAPLTEEGLTCTLRVERFAPQHP